MDCLHINMYIYIYIYVLHVYMYTYVYIHMYVYRDNPTSIYSQCVYTAVLPANEKLHVYIRQQVDKINEHNTQGGFSMSNINLFAPKEEHASKKSKTDDAHAR